MSIRKVAENFKLAKSTVSATFQGLKQILNNMRDLNPERCILDSKELEHMSLDIIILEKRKRLLNGFLGIDRQGFLSYILI